MLREDTILCFGTVTEPSRFSISMQSTLRSPSSQASASPTGPPPTMMTEVLASLIMLFRCNSAAPLSVVPATAGTHTPYHNEGAQPANNRDTRVIGPRLRGDEKREAVL